MLTRASEYRLILVLVILAGLTFALLRSAPTKVSATGTGTTSVIVELRDDPAAIYKARQAKSGVTVSDDALQSYRDQLRTSQDNFLNALQAGGISASVVSRAVKNLDGSVAATVPLRYTLVYDGLALNVPASSIAAIAQMPQVKSVHPDTKLYTSLNNSVPYIHAPEVYGKYAELTQFDHFNEGYEGQGINVAIIDTGVDWTHPMFGGDPTPPRLGVAPPTPAVTNTNQKVIYYLPLADEVASDGFGHGTHVASTVAGYLAKAPGPDGIPGTADDISLHGVAPQAKIMSYKVCSDIETDVYELSGVPIGGCSTSNIVMAIEDSISPFTLTLQPKPIAHVLNMSLGGGGGPDEPSAVAASNAAINGAVVVAASGNSGPGDGTTGAPAAGVHVISVGATTHPGAAGSSWSTDLLQSSAVNVNLLGAVTPAKSFPAASGYNRLKLFPMLGGTGLPAGSMAQHYVFISDPLGQWPASVRGRIALIKSAIGATIFDEVMQAYNAGAVGAILFDDRGTVNGVKTLIPAATISPEDGQVLVDALSSTDTNGVDPANGAISELPVRMNPTFTDSFMGEVAGFSSRGPVEGFGQVKPDISAPGVQVLAAVPPASVLGGLAVVLEGAPNYLHLDGTSMATPHMAGTAALVKQAHLDWTPDIIRTVLINTATNPRDQAGTPKGDGPTVADSIIAQGGGLIDVREAVNAKALMGVAGDGIEQPGILGSHSFGEVPVINNRTTHTETVTVTVRDLSGEGGTYNLAIANNRDLQIAGINVSLSQSSVTLQPNGTATYTVNATFDGDRIRDAVVNKGGGVFEPIQMQWFVTAKRSDNAESLRMPFYFKPGQSLPANATTQTLTQTGTVPVGDAGSQTASGVTYADVPFDVDASTFHVEATTSWLTIPDGSMPDVDYQLLDPDGHVIASSGAAGGPEHVSLNVSRAGTYTHRVVGYTNAATQFTITTLLTKGPAPTALGAIAGDFTNAQGKPVDFDGNLNLSWQAVGGATAYEVERSTDGTNYSVVASVTGTSASLTNEPNGQLSYRVRALTPGQIGTYVGAASNTVSVIVDRRSEVDITSLVSTAMSNVTFTNGVFSLDLNMKNNSTATYVPLVNLNVVRISSTSGTVSAKNADNGGSGVSANAPALYGYSNLLGSDQQFSPAETTGNRNVQFNDPASEMFTFDVQVTAYQSGSGGAGSNAPASGGGTSGGGTNGSSSSSLLPLTKVMRITVNPLTKTVAAKLF